MSRLLPALVLAALAVPAGAQNMADTILQTQIPHGEGWRGFTDLYFLANALFNLALAAALGAAVAYHPKHRQTADTLEEVEAAQIYILYSVIGSIIGILVVKYGMGVGFVLFGIGALIRFRTVLRSASLTGRLIFTTLIGLSCGLNLPHVAVLVTAFGFALIYLLDARYTYRMDIRALDPEDVARAAEVYGTFLERQNCRIIREKKNPDKGRLTFIVRSSRYLDRQELEELLQTHIEDSIKGSVDWEIG